MKKISVISLVVCFIAGATKAILNNDMLGIVMYIAMLALFSTALKPVETGNTKTEVA